MRSNYYNLTGGGTITAIGPVSAGARVLFRFAAATTINHDATALALLSGANTTYPAGAHALFVCHDATNWREVLNTIGGSAGAASYVVMALSGALSDERRLQAAAPVTLADGGANGDATIGLTTSPAGQTPVGVTRAINTTAPLTGGGDLSADRTLALADTAVTPGSYTLASLTVDAKGRLTAASSGTAPATAGRYLGTTVKTSGTSFTTGAGTNTIRVRVQAGGGGGGGVGTPGSFGCTGAGGAAGGYAEKTFAVSPSTAYAYAIGASGTAGASGGGDGGTGGDSAFTVGATTVTAYGGPGGSHLETVALGDIEGAAGPAVAVNGDVNAGGAPGGAGIIFNFGVNGFSGSGGSSQFGGGGVARAGGLGAAGVDGVGFGAGGSGAVAFYGGAAHAGGAGAPGIIVIEEFS